MSGVMPAVSESTVFYTHQKHSEYSGQGKSGFLSVCSSFDELLQHLESNQVDAIVFDNSVDIWERDYVSRWARIFKPQLQCTLGEEFGRPVAFRQEASG